MNDQKISKEQLLDLSILEYAPEKMRVEAEHMAVDLVGKKNARIHFLLIGENIPRPVECFWYDPSFGFFGIVGHEDRGYTSVKSLPKGSMILNQRIEEK